MAVLLPLPLNFANIIALPLLLGVGVSFNIYFVMNWRAGRRAVAGIGDGAGDRVLRADHRHGVRLAGAVGPSRHREHGELLLISLGCTLLASLVFIPALLASMGQPTRR